MQRARDGCRTETSGHVHAVDVTRSAAVCCVVVLDASFKVFAHGEVNVRRRQISRETQWKASKIVGPFLTFIPHDVKILTSI